MESEGRKRKEKREIEKDKCERWKSKDTKRGKEQNEKKYFAFQMKELKQKKSTGKA